MLTAREAGRKSVRKKNQSWVPTEYVEKSGWGPMNITMAQVYRGAGQGSALTKLTLVRYVSATRNRIRKPRRRERVLFNEILRFLEKKEIRLL